MGNTRVRSSSSQKIEDWLSDDKLFLISCWARDYNLDGVAERIGISRTTLWKWANKEEKIKNAINNGKEFIDYKVENALLQRALGFKTTEVKTIIGQQGKDGNRPVRIEKVEKELPPDVTACLAWLNNREPDKWKRNRDNTVELSDNESNVTINIIKRGSGEDEEKKTVEEDWVDDDDWSDVI